MCSRSGDANTTLSTGMAQITALLTNLGESVASDRKGRQQAVGVPGKWFGEVRVVTIVDAAEHPRDDVELRDPAGGAVERIGEHRVDLLGGRWHPQAVAMKGCGIGPSWATAPEFPVQQPEPWVHEVGPMQVAVHSFPVIDSRVDGMIEAVMDSLGDLLLVTVRSVGARVSQ